jgi:hypothetical protein
MPNTIAHATTQTLPTCPHCEEPAELHTVWPYHSDDYGRSNASPIKACAACLQHPIGMLLCSRCGHYHTPGVPYGSGRHRSDTADVHLFVCDHCLEGTNTWGAVAIPTEGNTFDLVGSTRKYGIEIETHRCPTYRQLVTTTCFGAKYDGSVDGMEFVSPILGGDLGLDHLEALLSAAEERDFQVGDDCGLHIHLDMSEETPIQIRHVAYAYLMTYGVWRGLVSEYRARDCTYCQAPRMTPNAIRTQRSPIRNYLRDTPRYSGINFHALDNHGTFEIRLHDGTLDYQEIAYWVMAHTRFIDAVRDMRYADIDAAFMDKPVAENFYRVRDMWTAQGGTPIGDFYGRRFHLWPEGVTGHIRW